MHVSLLSCPRAQQLHQIKTLQMQGNSATATGAQGHDKRDTSIIRLNLGWNNGIRDSFRFVQQVFKVNFWQRMGQTTKCPWDRRHKKILKLLSFLISTLFSFQAAKPHAEPNRKPWFYAQVRHVAGDKYGALVGGRALTERKWKKRGKNLS